MLFDPESGELTCSGILSWAVREEIPFVRAVRLVPRVMKEKLPAHFLGALDTRVWLIRARAS